MASLLSFELRGGAVMARHRRRPLSVAPPPELLSFDPDEWPAGEGGSRVNCGAGLVWRLSRRIRVRSLGLRWMCCVRNTVCMRSVGVLCGRPG